jgi:N-acetylglutamate synthase-like GNAT family acetyltransferase
MSSIKDQPEFAARSTGYEAVEGVIMSIRIRRHDKTSIIRKFNMTDLHGLHRMICETIDASYLQLYPPRAVAFFKEQHSEEKIAERSAVGEILVLISERDGSIMATGALIGSEIIGVFVCPDYHRQSYGKAIMTHLERIALEKGISKLSLSISLPSRQFYERLGYKVLAERVLDVGGGEFLKYWSGEKELRPRDGQKSNMATVEIVKTADDTVAVDELLWRVLWQPLGLPRNIRNKFSIDGKKIELAVKENGQIVGGLVAVWTAENEIELRHLAVDPSHQRKGIGHSLVTELFRIVSVILCHRIHTIARNTSADFFSGLGFRSVPDKTPEHPVFLNHGITFEFMERIVEQLLPTDARPSRG